MGQTMYREAGSTIPLGAALPGRARVPGPTGSSAPMPGSDRRADGQQRLIRLSRDCVRIDRRVAGVAMRVAVPVRSYRGVALSLLPDASGMLSYRLQLVHRDEDLSVALDCAGDDADILADWRLWSRFFRLPALVERRPGLLEEADATLGGLLLGEAGAGRRRPRFRSKRRPLFLSRRTAGDAALAAILHAGEREIIARD